jgi:Ca2+-transporting ATPase
MNELPIDKPRGLISIVAEVVKEPMFALLLACCLLYILIGSLQESLILSVFVVMIIGLTIFQSWKTEKTLAALKDLSSPKALVIRDGIEQSIPSRELVVSDIMIIEEGDKISADAIILETENLAVEESSLTGESLAVSKIIGAEIYSGTLVTQGKAKAKVSAIGIDTKLGKLGKTIKSIVKEESRFKKESAKLISKILIVEVFLSIIIIGVYWLLRNNLFQGLLTSLTFAMAMLPEEIPAVLTIFLALGAWRLSQQKVLTKKMPAVETLGSINVLCVDKTGTITQNKMSASQLYYQDEIYKLEGKEIPEKFHPLVESALLASRDKSFDPIEQGFLELAGLTDTEHLRKDWKLAQEYPLSSSLSAMSRAWDLPDAAVEYSVHSKGSPEAIFDLCHLEAARKEELTKVISQMAEQGLRVLGLAKSTKLLKELPANQHDIDFEFVGLVAFSDPIRPNIKEAVADCYSAGIRVIMITGDYHVTAQNIAKQIGLKHEEEYLTGAMIEKFSDQELQEKIKNITICSRVSPDQKLRIVNALMADGNIVAMTGDGVNDAAALKASHVGIAMGIRGTEVARQTADLVLLDDNFTSIVGAIRQGRRIYNNLVKAMSYILAIHIPIAGLTMLPVIFAGLPVIFYPLHIALLELLIDPTCSLVFESENEARNIMSIPPRALNEPILNKQKTLRSLSLGLAAMGLTAAVLIILSQLGYTDNQVRAYTFLTLIIANLGLTMLHKDWSATSPKQYLSANKTLGVLILIILLVSALVVWIPALRSALHF